MTCIARHSACVVFSPYLPLSQLPLGALNDAIEAVKSAGANDPSSFTSASHIEGVN